MKLRNKKTGEIFRMKTKTLSKQDFDSLKYHVRRTIACRAKEINSSIDTYSSQYYWGIAEEMRDDFELLNKLEELCGSEEWKL